MTIDRTQAAPPPPRILGSIPLGAGAAHARAEQPPPPDLSHVPPAARTLPGRRAPAPANLEAAVANLATLKNTEILLDEVIVLFLQTMLTKREADREQIMADGAVKMAAHKNAADDIRDGAVAMLAGAVVGGTISIGSGLASGAGATRASYKGGVKEDPMTFQNKMTRYQFANQAGTGSGQVVQGGMQYISKTDEAEKEIDESEADQAGSIRDSDRDDAGNDLQYIQAALQSYEKIEEARHEGMVQATQA